MRIKRVEGGGELAKRTYIGVVVETACPECGLAVERDLSNNYLSYPEANAENSMPFYCAGDGGCEHEWSEPYFLVVEPRPAGCESNGAAKILLERMRQISHEGFGFTRDDGYEDQELLLAAIHWATPTAIRGSVNERHIHVSDGQGGLYSAWPKSWGREWDKTAQKTQIERLAIAGALIAAEIDRLERKEALSKVES